MKQKGSFLTICGWMFLTVSPFWLLYFEETIRDAGFYALLALGWLWMLAAVWKDRESAVHLPMFSLLTVAYVLIQSLSWGEEDPVLSALSRVMALGFLILYVCNLLCPFWFMKKQLPAKRLLAVSAAGKLAFIPVFLIIFIFGFVMTILPGMVLAVPVLVVLDYFLLLVTSLWGICGMEMAFRQGVLSRGSRIFHTVLHLIFCLDVCSAVLVFWKVCKGEKRAEEMS